MESLEQHIAFLEGALRDIRPDIDIDRLTSSTAAASAILSHDGDEAWQEDNVSGANELAIGCVFLPYLDPGEEVTAWNIHKEDSKEDLVLIIYLLGQRTG